LNNTGEYVLCTLAPLQIMILLSPYRDYSKGQQQGYIM